MIESHADTVEDPDTITADPKRFGAYDILFPLGSGGMGEVFAARHVETGEEVALKTLSSATATRLYRFKREFRALADVSHPNLIRLRELVVPETGPAFLTMERLDAVPFVEWVRASTSAGDLPELDRLESALVQTRVTEELSPALAAAPSRLRELWLHRRHGCWCSRFEVTRPTPSHSVDCGR